MNKIKIGTVDDRDVELVNTIPWQPNRKALYWNEWLLMCQEQINEFAKYQRIITNVKYDDFYQIGKWLSRQYKSLSKLSETQKQQINDLYSEIVQKNK